MTPHLQAPALLEAIRQVAQALPRPVVYMEVCGTHTMSAGRAGLHSLLPEEVVTLLSGPGCPVCVTAPAQIDQLVALAQQAQVTICTYGDMIRVPGTLASLETVRSGGGDIRIVYSAMDALELAAAAPAREIVFVGVGFETTAPATAAMVLQARRQGLTNLSVLSFHKRTPPAMHALLDNPRMRLDGFLCPGHVAVITGSEAFRPVVTHSGKPCAVAGFAGTQILEALLWLLQQTRAGTAELGNLYPQVVTATGNAVALGLLEEVFEPRSTVWRGLGNIPGSGLSLRPEFASFDAARRFDLSLPESPEPPGCRCGEVITGQCRPPDCSLFGRRCNPMSPVGPCMVSSEGTCQAWYKYRRVTPAQGAARA